MTSSVPGPPLASATTSGAGSYELTAGAGSYTLTVAAQSFTTATDALTLTTNATRSYTLTAAGRLLTTQYQYDRLYRLTSATSTQLNTQYGYDAFGNRKTLTRAGAGTTNYTYDATDRLSGLTTATGASTGLLGRCRSIRRRNASTAAVKFSSR
ncbi:MAG: hypothetical protein HY329_18260 [Chloroflexi bacterium]|nr:hypothetical protein [Chloroflexota bacterium]